jgi:lipopolysaccharide/colanic/teichoic acid biosynthesis glycosyltransferase
MLMPLFLILAIIGFLDTGKPFFIQKRVGKHKKPFQLIKFRTMHPSTKSVATHLADRNSITKFGSFLRKSKLDELPQLLNVFLGHMSLVGPRPNLFNQSEVIAEREKRNVYQVLPGITGLSQIKGIDMSAPHELAHNDAKMISEINLKKYLYYIILTIKGEGKGDRVLD